MGLKPGDTGSLESIVRAEMEDLMNSRHAQIQHCAETLQKTGMGIGADPLASAMWLEFCFEVSYGIEESPVAFTEEACESFVHVKDRHGVEIARALFEMPSAILPSEIPAAAQYICDGGNIEAVPGMAKAGEFTPLAGENDSPGRKAPDHTAELTMG